MYEELLARVPLFQDLSRRELAWLDDACRERDYTPGEVLARQGGVGLLIVVEGSARITQHPEYPAETELEIGRLGPGAVWGESALLEDARGTATVTAIEPTRAVVLPIWDFHLTLRAYPDLAIHLLVALSRRAQGATG
jgi:CRP/FNR family transcriptional regulator, cyclic AMP receptor protein